MFTLTISFFGILKGGWVYGHFNTLLFKFVPPPERIRWAVHELFNFHPSVVSVYDYIIKCKILPHLYCFVKEGFMRDTGCISWLSVLYSFTCFLQWIFYMKCKKKNWPLHNLNGPPHVLWITLTYVFARLHIADCTGMKKKRSYKMRNKKQEWEDHF